MALLIAIILLIIGISAAWVSRDLIRLRQTSNDLYYAAVILAPILAFAIASGRMKQLKAGGLEAEFGDIVKQQIEPSSVRLFEERTIKTVKGSLPDLMIKIKEIRRKLIYEPQQPIVLTLSLGSANLDRHNEENHISHYGREALYRYINKLSIEFPSFKLIVILDQYTRVKAYIAANRLKNILSINNDNEYNENEICRRFIRAVNEGLITELIEIPGIVTTTVKRNNTNIEVLKIMNDQELEVLVVVDNNGSLSGVIDRGQFIDKLVSKFIIKVE